MCMANEALTDADCPNCGEPKIVGGVLLDCITGMRGYVCKGCDRAYTTGELRRRVNTDD